VIQPLHQDEATGQQTFIEAEGGETLSGAPEPVPGGVLDILVPRLLPKTLGQRGDPQRRPARRKRTGGKSKQIAYLRGVELMEWALDADLLSCHVSSTLEPWIG
jgi:hypothetical protein